MDRFICLNPTHPNIDYVDVHAWPDQYGAG
ncbi:hypothetical protein ACNKHX_16005 [Shigella flexneri]